MNLELWVAPIPGLPCFTGSPPVPSQFWSLALRFLFPIFFSLPSFSPSHCFANPYLHWLLQLPLPLLLSFSFFLSWSASNQRWSLHWSHHWSPHWSPHWLNHWSHHWSWRRQPRRERLLLLQASSAFSSQPWLRPPVQQ